MLDVPYMMLARGPQSIVEAVQRNLWFAPHLQNLANRTVETLKQRTGSQHFNGVHLRVEKDAEKMQEKIGGQAALQAMYEEGMDRIGMRNTLPMYVASGIFSNIPSDGSKASKALVRAPWYQCCIQVRASSIRTTCIVHIRKSYTENSRFVLYPGT